MPRSVEARPYPLQNALDIVAFVLRVQVNIDEVSCAVVSMNSLVVCLLSALLVITAVLKDYCDEMLWST